MPANAPSGLRRILFQTGQIMGGTLAGQGVSVLSGLVLTRLYGPDDFALLEWFALVLSLGMTAATLRLEQAVMLPESEVKAQALLRAGMWAAAWISVLGAAGGLASLGLWRHDLGLSAAGASAFVLLAVAMTFSSAQAKLWEYWGLRLGKTGTVATSNAIGPWATESVKWLASGTPLAPGGLVWGVSAGTVVRTAYLRRWFGAASHGWWRMPWREWKSAVSAFVDYPTWILMGSLTNRLAQWLHVVLLAAQVDMWVMGMVALSRRMVLQPLTVISQAFAPVFYRHISQISDPHALRWAFWRASAGLFGVSLLVCGVVYSVPEGWVGWVFGTPWEPARGVMRILAPWFLMNFITAGLGGVMHKLRRTKAIFAMDFMHLIFVGLGWWLGSIGGGGHDELDPLRGIVVAKVLYYLLNMAQMAWTVHRAEKHLT